MRGVIFGCLYPGRASTLANSTSTADSATGTIFPIGTSIAAVSKIFNQVSDPGPVEKKESERNYYTSTPGHKASLINHVAMKLDEPFDLPPGRTAMEVNLSRALSGDKGVVAGEREGAGAVAVETDFGHRCPVLGHPGEQQHY